SMNPQVLTTTTSAAWYVGANSYLLARSCVRTRSESTSAFGQPRLTKPTLGTRALRGAPVGSLRAGLWVRARGMTVRGRRTAAGSKKGGYPSGAARPAPPLSLAAPRRGRLHRFRRWGEGAGAFMHAVEHVKRDQHDEWHHQPRPHRRAPLTRATSGHRDP